MRDTSATTSPTTSRRAGLATKVVLVVSLIAGLVGVGAGEASASTRITLTAANDLIITGDNGAQSVSVFGNPAGKFTVKIEANGQVTHRDLDTESIRDIRINLRGGDDRLTIDDDVIEPRNVTIVLGPGDNRVRLDGFILRGNLRITDGTGNSTVQIYRMLVLGPTTIRLGGGRNSVDTQSNIWAGRYSLDAGASGRAAADIQRDVFGSNVTIRGGSGVDHLFIDGLTQIFGRTLVDLKGGNDTFVSDGGSRFSGRFDLRMGSGDDQTRLERSTTNGTFSYRGDGGDDLFRSLSSTHEGATTLNGGAGSDRWESNGSTFTTPPRVIGFE